MKHFLLIGAGFSANWGAPLAKQVRGSLLSDLRQDPAILSSLMNASKDGNFEAALAQIQSAYKANPSAENGTRVNLFQRAVNLLFLRINQSLASAAFEFSQDRKFSVMEFLSKFDAIFTLNQDLLLEMHYNPQLSQNRRWTGSASPGMRPQQSDDFLKPYNKRWSPGTRSEFIEQANIQPIFKLHGSSQWFDSGGDNLLVIGGEKHVRIGEHEILRWYRERFNWYLSQGEARLMVIGYGFRDLHINELLHEAWQRSKFEIWIVDPDGLRVRNPDRDLPLAPRGPLEDIVPIGETLLLPKAIFGGNEFELGELDRFFRV